METRKDALLAAARLVIEVNRIATTFPDYARGTVGNWWWKPQSVEEYKFVQSPYNTYLSPGLPPGPIANPGLSAIEATRNPAQTGYCFFVATGEDGRHIFVQTYTEQQQSLQTYGYNP